MVKCSALLLAVSIMLYTATAVLGIDRQSKQAWPSSKHSPVEAAVPIHRVILLTEPAKPVVDPVVIRMFNKFLAQKEEQRRKRSLPRPKLSGEVNAVTTFAIPGKPPVKSLDNSAKPFTTDQLTSLANLCLTSAVRERLTSRFRNTVLEAKDVAAAMEFLHLTPGAALTSDGAHMLCTRLEADAIVVIDGPVLTELEGTARELIIRAKVRIAALRDANGGFTPSHRLRAPQTAMGGVRLKPQEEFTVAGAAVASRAFMSAGYTSDFPALAAQAASQAASIAIHTLSTGEEAPFLDAAERIAIVPAYGPERADTLVLSSSGRYTETGAVMQLPTDVSGYFTPDLLPVLTKDVVDAAATGSEIRNISGARLDLWRDKYAANIDGVCNLGRLLKVQYVLLAHITDVETATAPIVQSEQRTSGSQQYSNQPSNAASWEREAHAEACGALIRVADGVVIWTDRGDTTVTSSKRVAPASRAAADRSIATEAEKFALIDLKRRFAAFRSQFEQ